MEAFEAARKADKSRFIGFSAHFDPEIGLKMLNASQSYDTILMPLHAADPSYLSFEETLLPAAVKRGLAIQGMKVFGSAGLRDCPDVRSEDGSNNGMVPDGIPFSHSYVNRVSLFLWPYASSHQTRRLAFACRKHDSNPLRVSAFSGIPSREYSSSVMCSISPGV